MQPDPAPAPAVELRGISKRFGSLFANADIDLTLRAGQIHALLGENGAGKSTLSKILYGLYQPDSGQILVNGQPVHFRSPADAIRAGVGMVTQHFALVPSFTVTENIILGLNNGKALSRQRARIRIQEIAALYGLPVHPDAQVRHLAVGEQQRVEILKALYRDCRVLILDEPTAVLTPHESDTLFMELKRLVNNGLAIVFISHKLDEVTAHCDAVTVLRSGRIVAQGAIRDTDAGRLARDMVGRDLITVGRTPQPTGAPILQMQDITARDPRGPTLLWGISLTVSAGEIVGLAGVAGSGQRELAEILSGIRQLSSGTLLIHGIDRTNADPATLTQAGVGRIPEDRLKGIIGPMSVAYNLVFENLSDYTRNGALDQKAIMAHAQKLIAEYQIKAEPHSRAGRLSGGNIQKVILARTLSRNPSLVVAAQPTRGLDIGATEYVHNKLREARARGAAILLISEDLDEILKLSDRVVVMSSGQIVGELAGAIATRDALGPLMGGLKQEGSHVR
jgi:simple sugar transport system ATP-binding protein